MPTPDTITVVYANCAGGARQERSDPEGLGRLLRGALAGERVVALGVSEAVLSRAPAGGEVPRICPFGSQTPVPALDSPPPPLDDLRAVQAGFWGTAPCSAYYLAHLNSDEHRHPAALQGKWRGCAVSPRLAAQTALSRTVYQGTGALLPAAVPLSLGLKLRPCGPTPLNDGDDDPWLYQGTRDSEPRAALLLTGVPLPGGGVFDLVYCQLESHSGDPRVGTTAELAASPGQAHRQEQVLELGRQLAERDPDGQRPVVLMGDFNARPGAPALRTLTDSLGFRHVLPASAPEGRPVPERSEEEQGWPVSHLSHRILIDHAFVRGLDPPEWDCVLQVLALPDERPGHRVSDHRPLVLRVTRR